MARKKKVLKAKEPIRLRFKELANGNKSLYLDIYRDGKRSYEFLKLYLIPEYSEQDRQRNENTMTAANAIKAQRIMDLTNGEAGVKNKSAQAKMLLLDWLQVYKQNQASKGKKDGRQIDFTIKLIKDYRGSKVTLGDVDKDFCMGFLYHIRHVYKNKRAGEVVNGKKTGAPLAEVTARNYYRVLNCALNSAVRADIINGNPFAKIEDEDKPHAPESTRVFLTNEEVSQLIATPCNHPETKQAFLFSCFCGLRISDIEAAKWGQVIRNGEQVTLELITQKTKRVLYVPLSAQALKWMPEQGNASPSDPIFTLASNPQLNKHLKPWAKAAGIVKNVTFHTARHTFATMLLTAGADLYTTSKLLGHSDVKVTQIYAKIVDKKKVEAVNLLNKAFDSLQSTDNAQEGVAK